MINISIPGSNLIDLSLYGIQQVSDFLSQDKILSILVPEVLFALTPFFSLIHNCLYSNREPAFLGASVTQIFPASTPFIEVCVGCHPLISNPPLKIGFAPD